MSGFGDDLIQAMGEALAHAKGEVSAVVHEAIAPREVRQKARLMRGADDAADGDEPVALSKAGTGAAAGQRTGGGPVAGDRAGAGGGEAGVG
jgi:hypothetical protein